MENEQNQPTPSVAVHAPVTNQQGDPNGAGAGYQELRQNVDQNAAPAEKPIGDVSQDDLADAEETPAPTKADVPTTGPYTAFGTIVRDSAGRTVAICGASHMSPDARIRLAEAISKALNS